MHASPLTGLLDAVIEWEIESAVSALTTWLDAIDRGALPSARGHPQHSICLCETEDAVAGSMAAIEPSEWRAVGTVTPCAWPTSMAPVSRAHGGQEQIYAKSGNKFKGLPQFV